MIEYMPSGIRIANTFLGNFIFEERFRYDFDGGNLFAFSMSQAERYSSYLITIHERFIANCRLFIARSTQFQSSLSTAGQQLDTEQLELFSSMSSLQKAIQMDIEAFYIFSKMLLDKLAAFIEYHFGSAQKASLASHDKLTKHLSEFARQKKLECRDGLLKLALSLKEDIIDFRDKQIVHGFHPRRMIGLVYTGSDDIRTSASNLYPRPDEVSVQSMPLSLLLRRLNKYTRYVCWFCKCNREVSRYRFESKSNSGSA